MRQDLFWSRAGAFCLAALSVLALPASARSVTVTYNYDVYGRLTGVSDSVRGDTAYEYDDAGNLGSVAPASSNQPPVAQLKAYASLPSQVRVIQASTVATDPDGDTLSFSAVSAGSLSNGNQTLTVTAPSQPNSALVINYTITDGNGGFDSETISIWVPGTIEIDPGGGIDP